MTKLEGLLSGFLLSSDFPSFFKDKTMNNSYLDREPLLSKTKSILLVLVLAAIGVLVVDQAIKFFTPDPEQLKIEFIE